MSFAIRVENVGKRYRFGATHAGSVRELVNRAWNRAFGRSEALLPHEAAQLREIHNRAIEPDNSFWALRDVSFDVQPGEVVGIIGRNGSGKSTLLKILSQITAPTTGRVELHGRVASLLEVGTGFHPELSGRENVFLNGAILGMTKAEISSKFDEIVAFAEIEKFIDTPVKRFSSGMYIRLAFAVAAHLEPEILIIDEVLAVGDTAFQNKCLGKISQAAKGGRTVLFVSHNLAAVRSLCSRAILFQNGQTITQGAVDDTVATYLNSIENVSNQTIADRPDRGGTGTIRVTRLDIINGGTDSSRPLFVGDPVKFAFHVSGPAHHLVCGFTIYDDCGVPVAGMDSETLSVGQDQSVEGSNPIICDVDALLLIPGRYRLNLALYEGQELCDHVEGAATFVVEQGAYRGREVVFGGRAKTFLPHKWVHPIVAKDAANTH